MHLKENMEYHIAPHNFYNASVVDVTSDPLEEHSRIKTQQVAPPSPSHVYVCPSTHSGRYKWKTSTLGRSWRHGLDVEHGAQQVIDDLVLVLLA